MKESCSRRELLKTTPLAAASLFGAGSGPPTTSVEPGRRDAGQPVKVVVWDEQQPAQKQAYANFLGNQVAGHLRSQPGLSVRSVNINDKGQGLASGELDDCQVLIWWGHVRHAEITPETGQSIVKRIKDGKLSLIALHSAHWSTPFVEAMNERTRLDAALRLPSGGNDRVEIEYVAPSPLYRPEGGLAAYALCVLAQVSRWASEGDRPVTALLFPGLSRRRQAQPPEGEEARPSHRPGRAGRV